MSSPFPGSFWFSTMSNSGAGLSSSASGPSLITASDPPGCHRVVKGDPCGDKSSRANLPVHVGTFVSKYRAYMDSERSADISMDGINEHAWDTRCHPHGETPVGAWQQRLGHCDSCSVREVRGVTRYTDSLWAHSWK